MEEWVHCNMCGQTVSERVSFFLTTCGHFYCERCVVKSTNLCAICKRSCEVKELNDKLDSGIKSYFSNVDTQLKKQLEVMKFQGKHRSMLIGHLKNKIRQQSDMVNKVMEENKQLKYDQAVLKKYINCYKSHIAGQSHNKPMTPQQLHHSPNMMSPHTAGSRIHSPSGAHGRMSVQSTPRRGPMIPHQLVEIQNTPSNTNRISVRPRPEDGKISTPSPRSIAANQHCAYSPMVASSDANFKPSHSSQITEYLRQSGSVKGVKPTPPCTPKQGFSNVKSTYFSQIDPTPPSTPKELLYSRSSTPRGTPSFRVPRLSFR